MALLIYKQWHRNANPPGTAKSNALYIKYIGERVHVLKKEINENGLFGKYGGKAFTDDIKSNEAEKYIEKISKKGITVFRSCISFTPERAKMLGLNDNLNRWEGFAKYHISTIAKHNSIGFGDVEYIAAVHLKKGQPHIHISFWNKSQQVGINYVNPEICYQLRDELETNAFGELAEEWVYSEENEPVLNNPNYVLDNGDSVRRALIAKTFENERKAQFDIQNKAIEAFINNADETIQRIRASPELDKLFSDIAAAVPPKGRLSYGYMPTDVKKKIDDLTNMLLHTFPELKEHFNIFIESKRQVAEMYNSTNTPYGRLQIETAVGKERDKLYTKVGNIILKAISSYKIEMRVQQAMERQVEYKRNQEIMRQEQMLNLAISILRLLKSGSEQAQGESTSKYAFGTGDLSKAARQELAFEHKDKGEEHGR